MTAMMDRPILPPTDPAGQRDLAELADLVANAGGQATLIGPDGHRVHLPVAVYEVLAHVVVAMRAGRAITIAPLAQRLTTQEAADLLGISRPTLVKLLESGAIPYEQPARHRRVLLADLLDYQAHRHVEQGRELDELVRETEELGLYDDEPGEY